MNYVFIIALYIIHYKYTVEWIENDLNTSDFQRTEEHFVGNISKYIREQARVEYH